MARTRIRRLRWAAGLTAVTCVAALSATTVPAHAAPEGQILGAGDPGSVSGSYLVTLKGGTKAPSAAGKSLADKYGAKISHTYGTVLNGYAVRADERQAKRLAADSRVASVVQDTRVTLEHNQKNPPSWGLDRIDQANLPLDKSYTWPESAGAGVTVYVIDTGIRISHKDFGGRASHGWDFVGNDRTASDGNGHGTHVAGTIAGGRYGVAKNAKVVAVRVLDNAGGGTTAQVIAGIDWVTKHARKPAVANVSLGGYRNAQLDAAVRNSIASGVTYTVAAGNDGLPAGLYSPAAVQEALTVGATDKNDARASFSNFGSVLDVFAPGVGITSASYANDTGRATYSGTSMASPHVAGVAALYLADHPKARPAQVSKAVVAQAVSGKVSGRGLGSPNELLQVPGS
ncbi:serine protease [Streptomyces viridochromogenes]|uniref:Serine protease n=1 Tax=Streptomyces viridochromogenes TaxID=1938 RepID=A0A0J7YS79_STRVR|nr:S8 family peptidase [Streptomyces viridochromogenes]KMS66337.1 serine protease [Streptomyces viridochromogenes]KOG24639.1 serine protease [Streptomyces viridochromogenes]KOG24884.1 serine protease [Streptomyces viridochromogenes]